MTGRAKQRDSRRLQAVALVWMVAFISGAVYCFIVGQFGLFFGLLCAALALPIALPVMHE